MSVDSFLLMTLFREWYRCEYPVTYCSIESSGIGVACPAYFLFGLIGRLTFPVK